MKGRASMKYGSAKHWFTGKCATLTRSLQSSFGRCVAHAKCSHANQSHEGRQYIPSVRTNLRRGGSIYPV
eukprot:1749639-Pyramimonas_sp.AAC.1